jgi:hypothetical protein
MRVGVVLFEGEVFKSEGKDILYFGVEDQSRKGAGLSAELKLDLLHMIIVNMRIPESMYKLPGLQITNLSNHQRQQGIGSYIERDSQENIRRALIELAGQFSLSDIKLEKRMTGWEGRLPIGHILFKGSRGVWEHGGVPGGYHHPTAVRVVSDRLDESCNLVDTLAIPISPLVSIDRAQVALFVCPGIPDPNPVFLKIGYIGIAIEEPEQFMNNRFHMDLLGGNQGKTLRQIKAHLISENAERSGTGTITFGISVFEYVFEKVVVLFHEAD